MNSIADELLKVDFDIPDGFTDMEFCPLGLGWTPQWPIPQASPHAGDGPVRG